MKPKSLLRTEYVSHSLFVPTNCISRRKPLKNKHSQKT